MARTTTNYGFNISEGTDLVNPLTDIFPNFESLDTDLKNVSNASIGEATELKTGTVHALTRTDTDKDVFKFTATSNFTAGDTFTVDTEQVSALTTSGEQLTTGCYIIGSEVLVAKKGTLLTFYISNVITDASTLEGHNASYFATASDLADTDSDVLALSNKVGSAILTTTAQDCSGAINELNSALSVRYNSQTDMVQIKDANGIWHDWKVGGLLFNGTLYENGTFFVNMEEVVDGNSSVSYNASSLSFIAESSRTCALISSKKIDLTNYNYLKAFKLSSSPRTDMDIFVSICNAKTGDVLTTGAVAHANSSGASNVSASLNISSYTGEYYVAIGTYQGSGTTQTVIANKLWLE